MPKEVKAAYIAAAGAILAALIAALFGLFSGDKPSTTNDHQTNSGDNSPQFGTVNGPVKVAYQGDINNYGISLEAHKRALEEREREVKERFSKTDPSDRIVRQVLEKEYNDIVVKLSNLEASFREEIAARSEIEKTLQELKENLPASQANKAIQKFNEGDKEAAKQLFDSVIKQAEESEELAGQAAFENGRMAEQEIRYLEAKDYYQKAVRFQPENSKYNNALGSMLLNLGDPNQA